MAVGITTWIHTSLLKGVPFRRRWRSGSGTGRAAQSALALGRKVDNHFKNYALSQKEIPQRTLAGKMATRAVNALRSAHCKLVDANIFLTVGHIKTHVDAIASRGQSTVVVELKTTSRTIEAFDEHYKHPCRNQDTVHGMENTEWLHHQLQLGWTTMAYRMTKQANNVSGIIVVVASDGARCYPLDESFARRSFWSRVTVAVPPATSSKTVEVSSKIPLWPGEPATRVVTKALGVNAGAVISKRILTLSCGSAVVASLDPPSRLSQRPFSA